MASEGVPLLDITGALGHNNASTTDKYLKRLSPTSVLDAMRERAWGVHSPVTITAQHAPAPGWVERLRADVGDRLMLFHDARANADEFKAIVLLF